MTAMYWCRFRGICWDISQSEPMGLGAVWVKGLFSFLFSHSQRTIAKEKNSILTAFVEMVLLTHLHNVEGWDLAGWFGRMFYPLVKHFLFPLYGIFTWGVNYVTGCRSSVWGEPCHKKPKKNNSCAQMIFVWNILLWMNFPLNFLPVKKTNHNCSEFLLFWLFCCSGGQDQINMSFCILVRFWCSWSGLWCPLITAPAETVLDFGYSFIFSSDISDAEGNGPDGETLKIDLATPKCTVYYSILLLGAKETSNQACLCVFPSLTWRILSLSLSSWATGGVMKIWIWDKALL